MECRFCQRSFGALTTLPTAKVAIPYATEFSGLYWTEQRRRQHAARYLRQALRAQDTAGAVSTPHQALAANFADGSTGVDAPAAFPPEAICGKETSPSKPQEETSCAVDFGDNFFDDGDEPDHGGGGEGMLGDHHEGHSYVMCVSGPNLLIFLLLTRVGDADITLPLRQLHVVTPNKEAISTKMAEHARGWLYPVTKTLCAGMWSSS